MFLVATVFLALLTQARAGSLDFVDELLSEIHPCDVCACKSTEVCRLDQKGSPVCLHFEDATEQDPRYFDQLCRGGGDDENGKICHCRTTCECERRREVCGSDGRTYSSHCILHQTACRSQKPIRTMHTGPCKLDSCTTKIAHPPPAHVIVYLNVTGIIQQSKQIPVEELIDWVKLKESVTWSAPLVRALHVLDVLDVVSLRKYFPDDFFGERHDDVSDLLDQSPVNRSAAILDAIETIRSFKILSGDVPPLNGAFNNSVVLPCFVEGANSVLWYHNGIQVENGPHHQYLAHQNGLLIANVRPVDGGTYTCIAIGRSCNASASSILNVRGLSDSADAKPSFPDEWMRFFHLTDMHLNVVYDKSIDSYPTYCQPGINAAIATYEAPYGRPGCDSPDVLIDNVLDGMGLTNTEPTAHADFIVVTGDFAGHGGENILKAIVEIVEKLKRQFPKTYIFPAFGNNDFPEDYYIPTPPNKWYAAILSAWSPYILCKKCTWRSSLKPTTSKELKKTFMAGGYYKISMTKKMSLLILNTNYYSVKAAARTERFWRDAEKQMKWLAKELGQAEKDGRKVIIAGHLPPGVDPFGFKPFWEANYTEAYVKLTADQYPHVIAGQLFAHMHQETYRLLFADLANPSIEKASPLIFTSAVTPVYNNNPNYRLMYVDNQAQTFTDFVHYYLDLARANQYNVTNWVKQYTFSKLFPSRLGQVINAERLNEIVDGIIDPKQSKTWFKYVWNSAALYLPSDQINSRFLMYCVMQNWNTEGIEACKKRLPFIPG